MRRIALISVLLVACADSQPEPLDPDPDTCPAAPFEHCFVHDNGWEVWCDSNVVYANDMTAHSYCYPESTEVACMTGGRSITERFTCTNSCATTERRYFDFVGDYMAFEPMTLCAP